MYSSLVMSHARRAASMHAPRVGPATLRARRMRRFARLGLTLGPSYWYISHPHAESQRRGRPRAGEERAHRMTASQWRRRRRAGRGTFRNSGGGRVGTLGVDIDSGPCLRARPSHLHSRSPRPGWSLRALNAGAPACLEQINQVIAMQCQSGERNRLNGTFRPSWSGHDLHQHDAALGAEADPVRPPLNIRLFRTAAYWPAARNVAACMIQVT